MSEFLKLCDLIKQRADAIKNDLQNTKTILLDLLQRD